MNFKEEYKTFLKGLVPSEDGNRYRSRHQKKDAAKPRGKGLVQEFEKEGEPLDVLFNGLQMRSNNKIPVALFTDKKTKSTFGVEPGQSVKSMLIETRKRFRL